MGGLRAVLLLSAGLLACGGEEAAKPDPDPPVTVPLTLPTTAEQILADDRPEPPADASTTTSATTATTLATGLPRGLGVPGAGGISLGGGSSISNGFTVREVAFLEVVAFVLTELEADGWEVAPQPGGADGSVLVAFAGPGAVGQALVEPVPDGTVHVQVVLRGG